MSREMWFIIANYAKRKEKQIDHDVESDYVSWTCNFVSALLLARSVWWNVNSHHKCNLSTDFNLLNMNIALRNDLFLKLSINKILLYDQD